MKKERILILDDDLSIVKMLSKILEKLGYLVDTVVTGEDAVKLFKLAKEKNKPYKFLILDLIIDDGMDGDIAFQKIRNYDSKVKAICSSGYSDNPILTNYKFYGFSSILPKPYTIADLEKAIQEI